MRKGFTWHCIIVGCFVAIVAGAVEYLMTEGISGWVPLIAGLAGILSGPFLATPVIMLVEWFRSNRKPHPIEVGAKPSPELLLEAWQVPGARLEEFKLYEAACLIVGDEPAWPLPTQLANDEFKVLVSAAERLKLIVVPPVDTQGQEFDLVWLKGDDGPGSLRDVKVDYKNLRKYLRSTKRPIPSFLKKRFDKKRKLGKL